MGAGDIPNAVQVGVPDFIFIFSAIKIMSSIPNKYVSLLILEMPK